MIWQVLAVAVLAALVGGGAAAVVLARRQHAVAQALAARLRADAQAERDAAVQAAVERVTELASSQLAVHVTKGSGELERSRALIDQQLHGLRTELERVTGLVGQVERDRAAQYGRLEQRLQAAGEQTAMLADATRSLREALSSTTARGQWGERMAEDVLRLAGFIEGVQYHKQKAVAGGGVPDFTFLLPEDRRVHMDVKFPLDNYLRYLDADSDAEAAVARRRFLHDVRARVAELAGRGYIDPEETLDCVLLFIPNEQLYAFIHEHDAGVLDEALRRKVVLCSPMTLFAVLAVIRQSLEHFQLARTSDEILSLLGSFSQQWERFTEQMDKLGRAISTTQRAYDDLAGTRRRQLERPLDRLDDLRQARGLEGDGPGSSVVGNGGAGPARQAVDAGHAAQAPDGLPGSGRAAGR